MQLRDVGDITLARNVGLTRALTAMQEHDRDVILLVDDDMVFDVPRASALVEQARSLGAPVSAAYILATGVLAARRYQGDRWLTGLGFLAVPRAALERLAETSPRFRHSRGATEQTIGFLQSSFDQVEPDGVRLWESEDFCFTRRLGGAVLAPIGVGHIKRRVMVPDMRAVSELLKPSTGEA